MGASLSYEEGTAAFRNHFVSDIMRKIDTMVHALRHSDPTVEQQRKSIQRDILTILPLGTLHEHDLFPT